MKRAMIAGVMAMGLVLAIYPVQAETNRQQIQFSMCMSNGVDHPVQVLELSQDGSRVIARYPVGEMVGAPVVITPVTNISALSNFARFFITNLTAAPTNNFVNLKVSAEVVTNLSPVSVTWPFCDQIGCLVLHYPTTNYAATSFSTNRVGRFTFEGNEYSVTLK